MIVALDWDGTVTGDPDAFWLITEVLRRRGHKVYIVTMRYPSECSDIFLQWGHHVDGIYATGRQAKQTFMLERNIPVGVWIDDNPRSIHENAKDIWGVATPEGTLIIEDHNHGMTPRGNVSLEMPRGYESRPLTAVRYSLLRLAVTFKRNYLDHPNGASDPAHALEKLQRAWWENIAPGFGNEVAVYEALALSLEKEDAEEGDRYVLVVPPALAATTIDSQRDAVLLKNMRSHFEEFLGSELMLRSTRLTHEINEMLQELNKTA